MVSQEAVEDGRPAMVQTAIKTGPDRLLAWCAIGLAALAAFHVFALWNFLYWKFLWLDIAMHFGGGAWAAGMFFWVRLRFPAYVGWPARPLGDLFQAVTAVAFVGVLWEFYEFGTDLALRSGVSSYELLGQQGVADTMSDLLFDLLGGLAVSLPALFSAVYNSSARNAPPSSR